MPKKAVVTHIRITTWTKVYTLLTVATAQIEYFLQEMPKIY